MVSHTIRATETPLTSPFLCKEADLAATACKVHEPQAGAGESGVSCFPGPAARKVELEETQNVLRLKTGNG